MQEERDKFITAFNAMLDFCYSIKNEVDEGGSHDEREPPTS